MKRFLLYVVFIVFAGLSLTELLSLWHTDWKKDRSGVVFVRNVTDNTATAPVRQPVVTDYKKMIEVQGADH